MFGGRKVVRATAGRRVTAAALKPLIEGGSSPATLIVEAGNLRPTMRCARCSRSRPRRRPSPAFPDEARDLETLVREALTRPRARHHAGGAAICC